MFWIHIPSVYEVNEGKMKDIKIIFAQDKKSKVLYA